MAAKQAFSRDVLVVLDHCRLGFGASRCRGEVGRTKAVLKLIPSEVAQMLVVQFTLPSRLQGPRQNS